MDKSRITNFVFLVLAISAISTVSPPVAQAQKETGTSIKKEQAVDNARSLIMSMMEKTHAPGVAVSIGVAGRIFWSEGFGYADVEQRVPVYPEITRFRIGSVSKPMTAVAVGQLVEQGLIDLDAPVQDYVPEFPEKKKGTVTTRLLAGHLAGIRHYRGTEFLSLAHYPNVAEGLEIFKDDSLLHSPGSKYAYSSYGWNLISAVVESASGSEFLEYMDENVFKRAGMDHTLSDQVTPIITNRTRYYLYRQGHVENAPPVDNSYKWAGGGFLSTSEDLVRFGYAHLDPQFLKSETVQLLWTSQQTTDGTKTGYGIGWSTGTDGYNRFFARHAGGSVGGTTIFAVYPAENVVVVVIANMSSASFGNLSEELADLFVSCCSE